MSNGIASGVPPADGGAGGVAGVGVCARADELKAATAQAASVIDTIERMLSSRLTLILVLRWSIVSRCEPAQKAGPAPFLP
jgi:hypothetical protein